jgi:epoxide hydrolase
MPNRSERFRIDVPDADLNYLQKRLADARWSLELANEEWGYGVNGAYLRELVDYWIGEFDWRAQEAQMNTLDHFRVDVDGQPVHFIHARSPEPGAIPLILTHG